MNNDITQHISLELSREVSKSSLSVKKYDTNSRRIQISLTNNGKTLSLENVVVAIIKGIKPDGKAFWNDCTIVGDTIWAMVTTQMNNVAGDVSCEIEVSWQDGTRLTSPKFNIHVYDTNNTGEESQNEYLGIGQILADTQNCKSQAQTAATNANASAQTASAQASNAADSATSAASSATSASESATSASSSAQTASTQATNASNSADSASQYKELAHTEYLYAKDQADIAEEEAGKALSQANIATTKAGEASASAASAGTSESNALSYKNAANQSSINAENEKKLAESYTKGGTGVREGEDTDNAKYYCDHAKEIAHVDIATTTEAGIVKPDGTSITVDASGTIRANISGKADLDENGHVVSSQLPSYVDDVIEADTLSEFPATGESGKIYVAIDTNLSYRWGGTEYVLISPSLALGETASTAYAGNKGKANADAITQLQTDVAGKYSKPNDGIPASDIADGVIPQNVGSVSDLQTTTKVSIVAAINEVLAAVNDIKDRLNYPGSEE